MMKQAREILLERLAQNQRPDGGFAYTPTGASAAEPTALATIALANEGGAAAASANSASSWLASQQRLDGAVPVAMGMDGPCWTTSLAILAWSCHQHANVRSYAIKRAAGWLVQSRGLTSTVRLNQGQHDASIIGWSWVDNTHSWVEPTAYAVLALRASGADDHDRAQEGIRLLRDRAIPSGGWNYGNSTVLDNTLRSFPETTGVALTALAGLASDSVADNAIAFLLGELPRIRSPLALGWGLIGLTAWRRRPDDAEEWIAKAVIAGAARPANAQHDALLLLASSEQPPFGLLRTDRVTPSSEASPLAEGSGVHK